MDLIPGKSYIHCSRVFNRPLFVKFIKEVPSIPPGCFIFYEFEDSGASIFSIFELTEDEVRTSINTVSVERFLDYGN